MLSPGSLLVKHYIQCKYSISPPEKREPPRRASPLSRNPSSLKPPLEGPGDRFKVRKPEGTGLGVVGFAVHRDKELHIIPATGLRVIPVMSEAARYEEAQKPFAQVTAAAGGVDPEAADGQGVRAVNKPAYIHLRRGGLHETHCPPVALRDDGKVFRRLEPLAPLDDGRRAGVRH